MKERAPLVLHHDCTVVVTTLYVLALATFVLGFIWWGYR